MSQAASALFSLAIVCISASAFLLARRAAARVTRGRGASEWGQTLAREVAGPLACILLVIPFALVTEAIFGVPVPVDGVVLSNVTAWLPAGRAGLEAGDVLRSMNGEPLRSLEQIRQRILATNGAPLTFDIERQGASQTMTVEPVQQAGHWMLGIAAPQQYRDERSPAVILKQSIELPIDALVSLASALRGRISNTLEGPVVILPESTISPAQRAEFFLSSMAHTSIIIGCIGALLMGLLALARWLRKRDAPV